MTRFQLGEKESLLVHSIYAAALAPEKWRAVLADIVRYIGADDGHLLFYDSQHPARNLLEMAFYDNKALIQNVLNTLEVNDADSAFKQCDEGHVVSDQITLQRTGKTQHIVREVVGSSGHAAQEIKAVIPLIQSTMVTSSFAVHCARDAAELSADSLQFLQRLAPHISRALHIYNQITVVKRSNLSLVESLKCSNLGIFLLDAELRVVFSTAEAQRILESNPSLHIGRGGHLEIRDGQQQVQLDTELRKLLVPDFHGVTQFNPDFSLPLHMADKVHPVKITAVALGDNSPHNSNSIRIGVFINDPERPRLIPQVYLQQAYGLTRTEAQIAQLLLNGLAIADVAARRNTSLETARWQIKSLMQKTSTTSQAELMRLLMLLSNEFVGKNAITHSSVLPTPHLGDV